MAATSAHIRKRQYQPSIKSYFNRDDRSPRVKASSPMSSPLPVDTQASLLSVGMRVRKSVPEGYKTHKTLGADGFPFPSTAPTPSREASRPVSYAHNSRELAPFCGLHKTGGWAAQPQSYAPPSSAPPAMQTDVLAQGDELPALSMSQSTIPSTQGSLMSLLTDTDANKKRTYEEEIEDDMDAYFDDVETMEMKVAPRRIAKLKGSHGRTLAGAVLTMRDATDFEEAAFLAPMDVDDGR